MGINEKKTLKSCVICGISFMGNSDKTTCLKCSNEPDKEAPDEYVYR